MQKLSATLLNKTEAEKVELYNQLRLKMQTLNLKKCWVALNKSKPEIYLQPCHKATIEVHIDDLKK